MKITKLEERIEEIALSLVAMGYMSANIEIPYTKKELMERIRGSTALYEKDVGKLLSLLETERSEAVIEYRINFEKGVQNVVENTVAKDRIEEIRKEAVREFAKWLNEVPITVVGDLELGYYISKHLTQTEGKK